MTSPKPTTTPNITAQPHELNWWDAVDKMLSDYLTDRGNKIPTEFPAVIKHLIKEKDMTLHAPTNCDPFYNQDADRRRVENYGAYTKGDREKVIAFVEFGTNREYEDVIIEPIAITSADSPSGVINFAMMNKFEPGMLDDQHSYLFLPRVDVTELHKKNPEKVKVGHEINIGYKNPQNPSVKTLVAKNTEVKKKEVVIPGQFKIVR